MWGFPADSDGQESACNAEFDSSVGKVPWKREWLATLVFLPGEFHGQRSLAGYGPWVHKELDMAEHTHILTYLL